MTRKLKIADKPTDTKPLGDQLKRVSRVGREIVTFEPNEGNWESVVSTGSTLLDLAISGTRQTRGGIPGGILMEVFGPSGAGKTVILCEIAGAIQRQGGQLHFHDPEARLNPDFAQKFDLDVSRIKYHQPQTINEVMDDIANFDPQDPKKIHGVMADSLAALSTEGEMEDGEDKYMGMSRAKHLSNGYRRVCRKIAQRNIIVVVSNQVRENVNKANPYSPKHVVTGGMATKFYCSVQLKYDTPNPIKKKLNINGKERERVIGVEVSIKVDKNSLDRPYRTASLFILFDYGIDDVRGNLVYLKDRYSSKSYMLGDLDLGRSLEEAIAKVEAQGLEQKLKDEVILVWEEEESVFYPERKKKVRV